MSYLNNMTRVDLSSEIKFQTTRSGGKGGQNVNKVETAVIGSFHIEDSHLLNEDQKKSIIIKLANRVNSDGMLQVKSQTYRSQLQNKEEVLRKINELVQTALKKKKKRIPTKVSKEVRKKRIESKKRKSEIKSSRKKYKPKDL